MFNITIRYSAKIANFDADLKIWEFIEQHFLKAKCTRSFSSCN